MGGFSRFFLFFLLFLTVSFEGIYAQGQVESKQIYSDAIAGNLIGDDPIRSISIYLPPSYSRDSTRRYPVVYFLHGYTDSNDKWYGQQDHWIHLPDIIDDYLEKEPENEMIFVTPNAYNRFKGSMYSSSVTIGDWETFIVSELVNHIDSNYRTKSKPTFRGLAGHSMGGYGTIRLAMKFPEVFASIYLLSPCCMEMNVNPNPGLRKNTEAVQDPSQIEEQPFFVSAMLAISAAWAPNAERAPLYLDLPFDQGQDRPEIIAKFQANSIIPMLDQYVFNLRKISHIGMDAGNKDWGINQATLKLHEQLLKYSIPHFYEQYEGDHTNQIANRIKTKVLPHFGKSFYSTTH